LVFSPTQRRQRFAEKGGGRVERGLGLVVNVAERFDAPLFGIGQARQLTGIDIAFVLEPNVDPAGLIALADEYFQDEPGFGKFRLGERLILVSAWRLRPTLFNELFAVETHDISDFAGRVAIEQGRVPLAWSRSFHARKSVQVDYLLPFAQRCRRRQLAGRQSSRLIAHFGAILYDRRFIFFSCDG